MTASGTPPDNRDDVRGSGPRERVAGFVRDLSYYLPGWRSKFKWEIYSFLSSGVSIYIPDAGTFYVSPESLKESDSFFGKEISVGFKLKEKHSEKPIPEIDLFQLTRRTATGATKQSVKVAPDNRETLGEREMYYTFFSTEDIAESKERFRHFISKAYESPDRIRARNRTLWDNLLSDQ